MVMFVMSILISRTAGVIATNFSRIMSLLVTVMMDALFISLSSPAP